MSRARILADYVSSGDELAAVATTANAALPKAGGAMTGAITTNSTFDGIDVATAVAANTAKTGISGGQASAITANTAKVTNSTNASDLASGTVAVARGGTGVTTSTGTGNVVLSASPTLSGDVYNSAGSYRSRSSTSELAGYDHIYLGKWGNGSESSCGKATSSFPEDVWHFTRAAEVGYIRLNTTSTTYSTSSDYRLKENIRDIENAILKIKNLKPRTFNFKEFPDVDRDGFIAHEAFEVVPVAVGGVKDWKDEDGNPKMQGIDNSFIVPILVGALQDAIVRIEALESADE